MLICELSSVVDRGVQAGHRSDRAIEHCILRVRDCSVAYDILCHCQGGDRAYHGSRGVTDNGVTGAKVRHPRIKPDCVRIYSSWSSRAVNDNGGILSQTPPAPAACLPSQPGRCRERSRCRHWLHPHLLL